LTSSDLDLEKAREARGQFERALGNRPDASPLIQPPPPFPTSDPPFLPWDHEMDADAQLQLYLDRAKEPKQGGFPPLEALSARLNEFTEPLHHAEASPNTAPRQSEPSSAKRGASDLEWFEDKFQELKTMLSRRESDTSEIVSINTKLAEIIDRVDRLSAALPGEKTMAAVETQLTELSRSLEATRVQTSSDANRIARAAKEILAATEKAQEARAGFEETARHTVKELGQTVVVSASRAAAVTAEHIAAALHERRDVGRLERVETELRALNTLSRESTDRTSAALDRIHETLRMFLEKSKAGRFAAGPKKRVGVHEPIRSDSHPYRIGDDFGSEPERKRRLDTITLRKPPPPDPNLLEALKDASEKLVVSKSLGFAQQQRDTAPPPAQSASGVQFRDDERSLPLLGLGIVAVILLIASAALYYLHTRPQLPPFHLSVLPDVQSARSLPALPLSSPQSGEAGPSKAVTGAPKAVPSLFTAADQNHAPSPSQPDTHEDLQVIANAASHGDREAQFRIAARFLSDGTLQGDPSTAARWLARAADQGHVESQFVLASLYERGVGVPKDETVARELYHKAASAGHIRAMHNLGVLLCAQDSPQDYQEAAAWFANAAMSGLADSQFNLAVLYERGLGLQQNNQKAFFWYEVASLAGDKEATRQAERLKRQLPDAETQAAAEQAGSWRPSVEQVPHLASGSASRS
jgi:localization factor PodJL